MCQHCVLASAGKQLVQDHLDQLRFTGADVFSSISSCELLHACTWLMARACLFEAYTLCCRSDVTVAHPLPHGILPECFNEAKSKVKQSRLHRDNDHATGDAWAAIEHTAHNAKRLHGRLEILQKQLQHGCVRHAVLQQRMQEAIGSTNVHATPYDTIVADSSRLLQKHLDSYSALCAEMKLRQATVELVPHFLCWVQNAMQSLPQRASASSRSPKIVHGMVMPKRILQLDEAALEQVP